VRPFLGSIANLTSRSARSFVVPVGGMTQHQNSFVEVNEGSTCATCVRRWDVKSQKSVTHVKISHVNEASTCAICIRHWDVKSQKSVTHVKISYIHALLDSRTGRRSRRRGKSFLNKNKTIALTVAAGSMAILWEDVD
jgi:hypothetical protein